MKPFFKQWLPVILLAAGGLLPVQAQVSALSKYGLKATNFKVPLSYYEGQYQSQARMIITGKEAQIQPDGKTYLVKDMKLEAYHETGEREWVVQSPECLFNNDTKTASSASHLQLQTVNEGRYANPEDKGLSTEGEGWVWDQGRLVISNKVHTVIHRELFKAEPGAKTATNAAPPQPLEIFAQHGDIGITNRVAIYTGEVKVTDPHTEIVCESLTVRGVTGTNQIDSVVAERNVSILNKQDQSRATGDKAVYTASENSVTLTGQPAVQNNQGKLAGDTVVLYRAQNQLAAHGNVRMDVNGGATNGPASPRQPLQVLANDVNLNLTNRTALYTGNVRAEDAKMQLNCDWLTVETAEKGGGAQRILARKQVVVINKEDNSRATGDEGLFTASDNVVTLSGNPVLENAQGKLFAGKIVLRRTENELLASDQIKMEVQYSGSSSAKTNAPSREKTNAVPLLVFADAVRANLTNHEAIYTGHVRADDSKSIITSDQLTVHSLSNKIETLVAEGSVTMTNRQDHSRGSGGKAVYKSLTDVVTLTDSPMLENELGKLSGGTIVLQRALNILSVKDGVKTEIVARGAVPQGAKPKTDAASRPAEPMLVFADGMEAVLTNRVAVYDGNVRVESTRTLLFCEKMTAKFLQNTNGVKTTNSIERIIADGKVVIANIADGTRASGTNAIYTAATDTVVLTGTPTIQRELGNVTVMSDEAVIWDRTANTLKAVGKSWSTLNPRAFEHARTNASARPVSTP